MVEQLALVLVGGEKERLLQTRLPQAGWVELRVDRFLSVFPREDLTGWVKQVRRHFSGRLVATVRWFKEQAAPVNRLTESEREKFYRILLPEVDYLDVELRSCLARKMVGQAHQQNRKVILSSHYFMSCPGNSALRRLYRRFRLLNGDILKVAARVCSREDLLRLVAFTANYSRKCPLVVIPMGTTLLERLIPLSFGSLFTYAALSSKTAPGQPGYREILQLWRALSAGGF